MSVEQEMHEIWSRIETMLKKLAPEIYSSLQPGASETTLGQVEAFIPITLPQEVKALYRLHDGQADRTYLEECTGLVNGWLFLPLKQMCYAWLMDRNDLGLPG